MADAWNRTRPIRQADLQAKKGKENNVKKRKGSKNGQPEPLYTVEQYLEKWTSFKTDKGPEFVKLDFDIILLTLSNTFFLNISELISLKVCMKNCLQL